MWAATSASPSPSWRRLQIPSRQPPRPPLPAIYANSQPPKTHADSTTPANNSTGSVKSLGHTILSAVKSTNPKSPNPNPKQRTPKQESEAAAAAAGQISGSDVLWALRKAAAAKEKNRGRQVKDKKKEEPSDEAENSEMNRRVRPLRINGDWGLRLSDLEKRLQEISETV